MVSVCELHYGLPQLSDIWEGWEVSGMLVVCHHVGVIVMLLARVEFGAWGDPSG